jgi:N-methylhydantoinase A
MRYRRQIHNEVWLTLPEGTITTEDLERIHEAFKVRYEELYGKGSAYEQAGKEIVTFRVDAYGRTHKPKLIRSVCGDTDSSGAVKHERSIFFQGPGFIPTPVYDYGRLSPGNKVPGPAVIEGPTTTVVIPPQREGHLDGYRNIIIE